jgi:hypothetical protein
MRRSSGRRRTVRAAGLALVCAVAGAATAGAAGAAAVSAEAASLRIQAPASVRLGQVYAVTTKGTFRPSDLTSAGDDAFFVEFLVSDWDPCQATAQLEHQLPHYKVFHMPEKRSPFTFTQFFTASGGRHRVCAYLYAKVIGPNDAGRPIATATAKYDTVASRGANGSVPDVVLEARRVADDIAAAVGEVSSRI